MLPFTKSNAFTKEFSGPITLGSTSAVQYTYSFGSLSSTEAPVQVPAATGLTVSHATINVTANTSTTAQNVTFRLNGANSQLVIPVAAGATGLLDSGVTTAYVNQGDLMDWKIDQATTGAPAASGVSFIMQPYVVRV